MPALEQARCSLQSLGIERPWRANLQGANLTGADLTRANFTEAKLTGTNFRGATLANAVFEGAELSQETLGLGRLPHAQRAKMKLVDVTPIPEDTPQEADTQISDNVKKYQRWVCKEKLL